MIKLTLITHGKSGKRRQEMKTKKQNREKGVSK